MNEEFIEPENQANHLEWREDDDGSNILVNTLTGRIVKRVKPLYLPDGTIMQTNVFFRVESARAFMFKNIAEIKQGDFLIAKKLINGEIHLWTNTNPPFMVQVDAKYKKDFVFITDLKKFIDGDLKLKLKRVLEIENYEYAADIRDELAERKILDPVI